MYLQESKWFVVSWIVGSCLSILIPLIVFGSSRIANHGSGGQQQQDDNQYQNKVNYNENGVQQESRAPWWWPWATDDQRNADDLNPTLVIVYIWFLIVFFAITYYGFCCMRQGSDYNAMISCLIVFANLSFISMMLIGGLQGGVQAGGQEVDENGWYGQFAVLLFMTCLFSTVFSVAFAVVFRIRARKLNVTKIDIDPSDYQVHTPEVLISKHAEAL